MNLKEQVAAIDDGRFEAIAKLDFSDSCRRCRTWTGEGAGGYRCACLGSCPGVTLSEEMKDYIKRKIS